MTKCIFFCLIITSCIQTPRNVQPIFKTSDFKDSFLFQNLTHFVIDSTLILQLKDEKKLLNKFLNPNNIFFDTLLGKNHYLLYSWQEHSPGNTKDFTVLTSTHLDQGVEIHYIKLDDANRIISDNIVARRVTDTYGSTYIQSSEIVSEDTILVTRTSIYLVDETTLQPLLNPRKNTVEYEFVLGEKKILTKHKRNRKLIP